MGAGIATARVRIAALAELCTRAVAVVLIQASFFRTLKNMPSRNAMTIHLTPEQEQRVRAVIRRGDYDSVAEVVEAALMAVEQRTIPGFRGTPEELEALLAEGLASRELSEDEFWSSVNRRTDAMLSEHKANRRS